MYMPPWQTLAPQTDFYGAFMRPIQDKQAMQRTQLENQAMQTKNKYLAPMLESDLEAKSLANIASEFANQEAKQRAPYNIPMLEAALANQRIQTQKGNLELRFMPQEQQMRLQDMALRQAMHNLNAQRTQAEINTLQNGASMFEGPSSVQEMAHIMKLRNEGRYEEADLLERLALGGSGNPFSSLPANDKSDFLAQARGLDIEENIAQEIYNNGGSLEDEARRRGKTEEEIKNSKRIHSTPGSIKAQGIRQLGALMESEYLTDTMLELTSDFIPDVGWFANKSPEQITDFFKNAISNTPDTPERDYKIAGFAAAYPLAIEAAATRGRGLGLSMGIEMARHLEESYPVRVEPINELLNAKQKKLSGDIFLEKTRIATAIGYDVLTNSQNYQQEVNELAEHGLEEMRERRIKKKMNSEVNISEEELDAQIAALEAQLGAQ